MTLQRRTEPLVSGLPQTFVLDAEVSIALTLPNGLAAQWRDADPRAVVSSSGAGAEPHAPDDDAPAAAVGRPPLRLLVVVRGATAAAVPLVARVRRPLPDAGGPEGVRVELEVLGWRVHAGTLRGGGDFGSFVDFAWRRADSATGRFEPPPLNPMYLRRVAA